MYFEALRVHRAAHFHSFLIDFWNKYTNDKSIGSKNKLSKGEKIRSKQKYKNDKRY